MSATVLDVFDKSLHATNAWLDEIADDIGPDRHVAWKVITVVLHKTRDQLPVELAARLGAELPLLIRGAYYDPFEPNRQKVKCCNLEELTDEIAKWLSGARRIHPSLALQAVWATLSRQVPVGLIRKVQEVLPHDLREFWHAAEEALVWPLQRGSGGRPHQAPEIGRRASGA